MDGGNPGRELRNVVTLPRSALRNDGSVLLVDAEDGCKPVMCGCSRARAREVWVQGVERNERVVVSPAGRGRGRHGRNRTRRHSSGGWSGVNGVIAWFVRNPIAANLIMVLIIVGGVDRHPGTGKAVLPGY